MHIRAAFDLAARSASAVEQFALSTDRFPCGFPKYKQKSDHQTHQNQRSSAFLLSRGRESGGTSPAAARWRQNLEPDHPTAGRMGLRSICRHHLF